MCRRLSCVWKEGAGRWALRAAGGARVCPDLPCTLMCCAAQERGPLWGARCWLWELGTSCHVRSWRP